MSQKTHYTAKELAGLPGMPTTEEGTRIRAEREGWASRKRAGRGGGKEYFIDSLPDAARSALASRNTKVGYAENMAAAPARLKQSADQKEQLRLEARAQSMATFNRLSPEKQLTANAKLAVIQASSEFILNHRLQKTLGQQTFCHEYNLQRIDVAPWVRDQIPRIGHPSTLRDWIKEEYELGMMGLVDCYGNRRDQSKIETWNRTVLDDGTVFAPMAKAIEKLILAAPHIAEKKCNESLQALLPEAIKVSDKSVKRYMDKWKAQNPQLYKFACSPDGYKNTCQPAFGSRSEGVTGIPNRLWEIDATPADLLLTDGIRYKIIGITDVGVARVKLLVTRRERVSDNAFALRRCFLDWGVPWEGTLRTDQGSVYKAPSFRNLIGDMEIEHHICNAFSGDEKPHIERLFRTFSHDLVELLPGYCGHSVAERQKIESRKSFADRLLKRDEVIEMKMTSEQLQAFCDRWSAIYHDTEQTRLTQHFGVSTTPNQALAQWTHPLRRITDERALDVLLYEPARRGGDLPTIQKKGIRVEGPFYIHELLEEHIGKKCRAYQDPVNIGRIVVYIANEHGVWEFLCVAIAPDLAGEEISRAEVATAARELHTARKRELTRITREARRELTKTDLVGKVMDLREQKAAEAKGNVTHLPPRSIPFESAALAEAARAAAALERAEEPQQPQFAAEDLEAAGRQWLELTAAREAEKKVIPLPTAARPMFGTDREKYQWLKRNQPLQGYDDATWMAWYETTTEYQLMFGEAEAEELY